MSLLKKKGFTLIELLVTIGIIILLAALIIVNVAQARQNGRDTKRISDLKSIQTALEMNFEKSKSYPISGIGAGTNIDADTNGWAASSVSTQWDGCTGTGGDTRCLKYFLSSYISPLPKDPMNGKSIDAVLGTGGDCNVKAPNTTMSYQYKSDADGSSYKIKVPLETRCEGLDKNDGGIDNSFYELWGGKDGRDL